jgi:hypothetical protein
MSQTAVTATMSSLCIALIFALMAAGGARPLDLTLVAAFGGLMAAACALAGLSPTTEEEPCKQPSA